jgi:N-succinyldiaminopimelate aminotransferase
MRTQGTYFITADIRPLGLTGPQGADGEAFCRALPHLAGVVAIPSQVFYDHREQGAPYVRFAFCKRPEVLTEAAARLKALASR